MWIPGVPPQRASHHHGSLPNGVKGCVLHRTIGTYTGDDPYLLSSNEPTVHFLVGEQPGQWAQFYDTEELCWHANGANSYSVGIEISGQNGAPLTAWQLHAVGFICRALATYHHIPRMFYDDEAHRVSFFAGFLTHRSVLPTQLRYKHFDYITLAEFQAAFDQGGTANVDEDTKNAIIGMSWVLADVSKKVNAINDAIYNGATPKNMIHDLGNRTVDMAARIKNIEQLVTPKAA